MLGDCMDLMKDKPDNYYDLSICDPPYGIKEPAFRRNDNNSLSKKACKTKEYNTSVFNQHIPDDEYFKELFRVSKNQIIWGGNYFSMKASRCWIVWDKHTKDAQWADAELAWTSFKTSVRIFDFAWNGMIQGDMKNKEQRIHPTQKPVALYKWLLQNYAKEGDKILDTHGGSMSIAIACWDLKFDLDIIEKDADYYKEAVARVERHKDQLQMF